MPQTYDAIVVGAGVAGLAATAELSRAGMKVLCLEAGGRIGGRIHTIRDAAAPMPVELGAEFIHGRPPNVLEWIRRSNLAAYENVGKAIHLQSGAVMTRQQTGESAEVLLKRLRIRGKDRTLSESIQRSHVSKATKTWAVAQIEGFNAAHQERVSVAALKEEAKAASEIEGDCVLRLLNGYDSLAEALFRSIPNAADVVRIHHRVKAVEWKPNDIRVSLYSEIEGRQKELRCTRMIVTVPLGVLQATPAEGGIRFDPEPDSILRAARGLEFGHVYRVIFRFREAFWEDDVRFMSAAFLISRERVFPTWWTAHPVLIPMITGWSAGAAADPLRGSSRAEVIQAALSSLSNILQQKIPTPIEAYFHDWSADPLFRGAYSYVPAGAVRFRAALAKPVANTLFFAGEATNTEGHASTVHGALATGVRAAKAVLTVRHLNKTVSK